MLTFATQYRGVEQLVARRAHNPEVVGSSPAPATKAKKPSKDGFLFFFNLQKNIIFVGLIVKNEEAKLKG